MSDIVNGPIQITPDGALEILSKKEVSLLLDSAHSELFETFRKCALAVLNCGTHLDDSKAVFERYRDFAIHIRQQERGIKLELVNAPASAFVDGQMIRGIREHLFAVLRDIVYTSQQIVESGAFDLNCPGDITDAVFHILRNAQVLIPHRPPDLVVCWGGHAISPAEYDYSKQVGYELGLRGMHICTGCGPGAMKGPMKGATIGHAKQRLYDGRYLGISEPGIIAAEPPNPIVNQLVIMPDIEKRLEAFVRVGHGIVVFPGGVGTFEEILYLLGILLHPANDDLPFPLLFTGPETSRAYFERIDAFLVQVLGERVRTRYRIVVGDPVAVAREMREGLQAVHRYRLKVHDAYYFNWRLVIDPAFQKPFLPTHENVAKLRLSLDLPPHELAAELRRAFSAIVAANVKELGIIEVERHGPFEIRGDRRILGPLQRLLDDLVAQRRMKLAEHYEPTYRLIPL
ncbi:pyrimidine/purine-5'-nucleotide nucleosidase [Methylomarinovum tepidoasis]|uniref:AMP nucleosidase n=1 Tax=Methylomarinovum tepidoasis TaxID=2840183 RepID=A0AAU9C4W3_9GAMM|nr:nucleotide 5'-monophosphate nucleosidase PpnN [Methylomarinovum sp. IN45]BCX88557.1 pyrimidine/purine-5'-nucleotide nucleosidase [Methylomarinovum sp. IN45]